MVTLGGGHGLAVTIRAARPYAGRLTAVVATADDGGSTGRLRADLRIPAPGDLRRCLVAMSGEEDSPWGRALEHRFDGTDVAGHALGNLLLAGLEAVTGDFLGATAAVAGLLGLDPERHRVVPATVSPVDLWARTEGGEQVRGQVAVSQTEGIAEVGLDPALAMAPAEVAAAIMEADQVVLGPGDLYTSVLAAAIVDEVREALVASKAQVVYVCNVGADNPETRGYGMADHVGALLAHGLCPDVVVLDSSSTVSASAEEVEALGALGVAVMPVEVARPHGLSHDSAKLGPVLAALAAGAPLSEH